MSSVRMRDCSVCGGKEMYSTKTSANGGYGPALLPSLGRLFKPAKFDVYVCESCGHTTFFADKETRKRLQETSRWKKVR